MTWRRSGTVSSIALKANRKPSSALIAANRALAWLLGAKRLLQQLLVLVGGGDDQLAARPAAARPL